MTTETAPLTWDQAETLVQRQVAVLNEALGLTGTHRVTFGYIGNCGSGYDDRRWMVFFPHPGRMGSALDGMGGYRTGDAEGLRTLATRLGGAISLARWMGQTPSPLAAALPPGSVTP